MQTDAVGQVNATKGSFAPEARAIHVVPPSAVKRMVALSLTAVHEIALTQLIAPTDAGVTVRPSQLAPPSIDR
jgi:hypothetical protein